MSETDAPESAPPPKPKRKSRRKSALITDQSEWSFDSLQRAYEAIEEVGIGELDLDVYPNQIEVITSEQMLDAYSSIGMPLMYRHWSYGKHFARDEMLYRKGAQGLAYELVINSNPCISYVMEENSTTMQALVIAHAGFGHNHFFKNNYLFQQWTDADGILDYLAFAKAYVTKCEEIHGIDAVEQILDAAHALMKHGVNRYARPGKPNLTAERERRSERIKYLEETYNDLWRTLPTDKRHENVNTEERERELKRKAEQRALGLPEENLLYFLEKNSPKLEEWQRELLRIVRNIGQYFYPQKQTKVMNEGCATFVHYEIMNRLYDKGAVDEGAMLEFLRSHSAVVFQPDFDDPRYSGLNPYALGFAMMKDIQRICTEPTEEDHEWFPDIAGNGDALGTLKDAWAHYRDESFILQFLSPKVMRDFRLFSVFDDSEEPAMMVEAIHDKRGYEHLRRQLARQYDIARIEPEIQITDVDLKGNRRLILTHHVRDGQLLNKSDCDNVLLYLAQIWGYGVKLLEVDVESGRTLRKHTAVPLP